MHISRVYVCAAAHQLKQKRNEYLEIKGEDIVKSLTVLINSKFKRHSDQYSISSHAKANEPFIRIKP